MFKIKETNNNTGRTSYIKKSVHTTRGWFTESKTWKTEKAAKAWITRRENELKGTINEGKWSYEIVK